MSSTSETRLRWVDCCKGLCILLVVYGHVSGGLTSSGAIKPGSAFDLLRSWVYLFHMPTFFLLSGLFARRALAKPFPAVLAGRVKTLAYPYVLWTGIFLGVTILMARFANNPPDAGRAAYLLWQPYGYGLWFLYSLFLISLLFHLCLMARLPALVVLLLAVACYVAAQYNAFAFWPILNESMLYFVFYALAGLYAQKLFALLSAGAAGRWWIAGLLSWAIMTALAALPGGHDFPAVLPEALLGIAGAVCLAQAMAGGIAGGLFGLLGFYSLEIYLGHPLFSTAARAVLNRTGVHGGATLLFSCVTSGVVLSLALGMLCRKLQFPFLYRWPAPSKPPRARSSRTAEPMSVVELASTKLPCAEP